MANKLVSEDYADLIVENDSEFARENPTELVYLSPNHSILHIPIEDIDKCSIMQYGYRSFPACYTLESISSLDKSGVTAIQNLPNLGLRGEGVLIGVIDTGIDYTHEAFINPDGTSKIVSIWDQTIQADSPGTGNIKYGTEYQREQINNALNTPNPLDIVPTRDEIGHGTALAGIIAGNESLSNDFRGVVPNAELVIVKMKQAKNIIRDFYAIPRDAICFQATDVIFGVNYVIEIANRLNRPMAICIALGSGLESHDSKGVISAYFSYIAELPGKAIIVSAGNEGNAKRHYMGTIDNRIGYDEFELRVGPDEYGFSMEIWQGIPHRLSVTVTSPSGEFINPILPSLGECRRNNFIFESTVMYINNIISEPATGDQLILFRFEYPAEGIWRFRITNIDELGSTYNAWLPSGDLISNETYFLRPDPDITITAPGNALVPITATAYNHNNDSIWNQASRGYTRNNDVKPDMAAPGVDIVCPAMNNRYTTITGTGAAAAHTCGIVAMLLEWGIVKKNYDTLNVNEIKDILISGARRQEGIIYPNNIWGYGMINILGAFQSLR